MLRRQLHQRIHRLPPGRPRLLRQSCNQIKTDIRDPRPAQNRCRAINIRSPMHPPRRLQLLIAKRLHPKTNPINPRRHPSRRLLLSNRLRIRLQSNFRQLASKIPPNRIHKPSQMPRIKQTRRPAADINRIHHHIRKRSRQTNPGRLIKGTMPGNLPTNARHIRSKPRRRHHPRMEVAISTLRLTKRHLHINPNSVHNQQTLAPLECGGLAAAFTTKSTPKPTFGKPQTLTRAFTLLLFNPWTLPLGRKSSSPSVHQTHKEKSPAKSPKPTSHPPQKSPG